MGRGPVERSVSRQRHYATVTKSTLSVPGLEGKSSPWRRLWGVGGLRPVVAGRAQCQRTGVSGHVGMGGGNAVVAAKF